VPDAGAGLVGTNDGCGIGGTTGQAMTPGKRLFDITLALVLLVLLAPVLLVLLVVLAWRQGLPLFYVSERMKTPDQGFALWKLRTMTVADRDAGVSGGDKVSRITPMGRFLRRSRLDEVPQLWNILRGDISFVGPRPELRRYVEMFPALFAAVLECRPGVTGLATLHIHRYEERVLACCITPEATEAAYIRLCIPRKARLDLIYRDRRTLCLDVWLILRTALGKRLR